MKKIIHKKKSSVSWLIGALALLVLFASNTRGPVEDFRKQVKKKMQGTWIHEKDSLASVTIDRGSFSFNYVSLKRSDEDKYTISISDSLPKYATVKAHFLILVNKADTLNYEILGVTNTGLSLMHFPTGRIHVYRKLIK